MALNFSFGRVESRREIREAERFIVARNAGYDPRAHREWAFSKFIPRVENGQAGAVMLRYEDTTIGLAGLYAELVDDIVQAELKLVRLDSFRDRGWGRFLFRQSVVTAAEMTDAAPGSPIVLRLDTRSPEVGGLCRHLGFTEIGRAPLYEQTVVDTLYALHTHTPRQEI